MTLALSPTSKHAICVATLPQLRQSFIFSSFRSCVKGSTDRRVFNPFSLESVLVLIVLFLEENKAKSWVLIQGTGRLNSCPNASSIHKNPKLASEKAYLGDYREYFHSRNKANLAVTTGIVILSIAIMTTMQRTASKFPLTY